MTTITIQGVVLQIKDKNEIWEDKVEEVYLKKKLPLFMKLIPIRKKMNSLQM